MLFCTLVTRVVLGFCRVLGGCSRRGLQGGRRSSPCECGRRPGPGDHLRDQHLPRYLAELPPETKNISCNEKSSIMQLDNGFQYCCYSTCNLDFLLNGICIICCGFGLQRLVEAISFKSSYIIIIGYILSFHSSVS